MKSLSVGSLFLLCFLQTQFGFAQNVGINVSGLSPNTAAILDIDAAPNFNKGLLIPRVTFSQRTTGFNPLSAAAQGLTVYQTDAGGFGEGFYFNTSTSTTPSWSFLLNNTSGWSLTGNAVTTPSSSAIGTAIAAGQNYIGTSDLKDFVMATNNLERLRITANGNVGIGISAPAFTLDVNGGARALLYTFPAPTGDPAPVITARTVPSGQGATSEKTELILFHSNDPANAAGADQITLRAPALSFQTFNDVSVLDIYNNVGYNERMYINSIGNVGIGTIAPQTLLHLTRPAGGNGNLIFEGNSSVTGAPKIFFIDITGAAITTAPSWMISNTSDKMSISRALTLGGTYADFMNISNTGNIGIGTSTPSTQLHSTGGVRFQILAGTGTRLVVTDANGNLAAGSSIASGIVTGSGILNYVPKWTPDGATLGNSLIFDNGTNVGIGTAGPGNKFGITISSNDAIPSLGSNGGSFGIFKTDGATPGNYGFIMGVQGSGNVFQQVQRIDGSVTAYNLLLQPSGGNVGIGTSSPGAKLHAYMIPSTFSTIDDVLRLTSKFESTGNAASAAIGNGPAIVFSGGIGDNQTRDRARIVAVYEGSNVSGLAFHTQNTADIITEKMRIQNNGNVGIGTTAPSTKFEIWADFGGSNKVSYTHQGGGESKWWDGAGVMRTRIDATDPYQLDMFNSIGTRVIGFTTDGGNTFINSGNVGIGTSSPGAKLHAYMIPSTFSTVDDVLRLTSKFESTGNAASAAIGNGPAIVFSGGIGDNQTRDRARIVAVYEGSNVSGLAFHTQNTADIITEKMRIQNNGNVGIGTVNPAAPLEVQKSGGSTSSVNVALILDYESSTTALAEAGTAILFRGKSSGGNIANYNHAQIRSISQNTNNAHGLAFDYKPNAGAALTEAMRIGTSGNIGIGATAPTTQLHTTGGVRFQTLTGTGNRFVITDLDGNISAGAATTAGIITGSGTLNYVPKWTPNGTALANSNIFDNGTNVGIGSVSPGQRLSVDAPYGLAATSGTTQNGILRLQTDNGVGWGEVFDMGMHVGVSGPASHAWLQATNKSNLAVNYNLVLNPNGGNVGIGTTVPASLLHLYNSSSNLNLERFTIGESTTWGTAGSAVQSFPIQMRLAGNYNAGYNNTAGGAVKLWLGNYDNDGSLAYPIYVEDENSGIDFFLKAGTVGTNANSIAYFGGNVGIGTTSPVSKFHLSNGAPSGLGGLPANTLASFDNGSANNYLTFRNTADNGTYSGIQFQDNNVGGYIAFRNYVGSGANDGNNGDYMVYGSYTDHIFQNGGSEVVNGKTETMRIKQNGNVGIGTTSPAALLNISGAHSTTQARLTLPAGNNGAGTGEVNLQLWVSEPGITWDAGGIGTNVTNNNGAPSGFGRINTALGQSYIRFITNGGAMAFNTTNNSGTAFQTMYMAGGNVGIGTTAPIAKLDVNSNINITGGVLPRLTGASSIQTARNVLGTGLYNYQTYNDPNAPTTYGAAVGFGNGTGGTGEVYQEWTSPYRIYHRALRDCCENWSGWIRMLDINDIPSGIVGGSGTINYLARWTSATTLGIGATFDNGTNVGIGTTSPAALLNISGAHSTTQARLTLPAGNNGAGTGEVNLQLWVSEPGITWDAGGIGTNVTNNNGAPSGFGRINAALGQSYIRFITNGGAMAFNTTNNSGTAFQTMYMAGGNVGIGTTSPAAALDVNSTTQGFLPPRMTKAQRDAISSPADGLIIYCSDCSPKGFRYRVNGAWLNTPSERVILTSTNPGSSIYPGNADCIDDEAKIYMTSVTLTPGKWRVISQGSGYKYSGIASSINLAGAPVGPIYNINGAAGFYFSLNYYEEVTIGATTTYTPFLKPTNGCHQSSLDKVFGYTLTFELLSE